MNAIDTQHSKLHSLTGTQFQVERKAQDPVSSVMIRRWLEAFGAEQHAVNIIEAPAAMLGAFTGPGMLKSNVPCANSPLADYMKENGLVSLGAEIQQTYDCPIRVGDFISEVSWPETVSERKRTAMGDGYFITYRTDYTNQYQQSVGVQRMVTFAFQPGSDASQTRSAKRQPEPESIAIQNAKWLKLAPWVQAIDRMRIISCCTAMGSFHPVHFDPSQAQAIGLPDIFCDIYSGVGFTQVYLSKTLRKPLRFRTTSAKLGIPLFAGDSLTLKGKVSYNKAELVGECSKGIHFHANAGFTTL